MTEEGADHDLDTLIERLRSQQKLHELSAKRTLPSKPTVEELWVDSSDTPSQMFAQKLSNAGLCNSEGWYWTWDPRAGHMPVSVWCSRPRGHTARHEARAGIRLHRHKVKVFQWDDDSSAGSG